ncbi:uncharacterized protein [Gossypium hirsutum]|uniref:Secreted protein n=1 Tax=Gossypium hirsutum TaxID=3635 RepID=A0ABM3AFS0_GOSHI|nr:uncharacterized protein LOC107956762 [Gossypium hirsutum]
MKTLAFYSIFLRNRDFLFFLLFTLLYSNFGGTKLIQGEKDRITTLLDWSRHWALSTFYMGSFKLKGVSRDLATRFWSARNPRIIPRSLAFQRTDTVDAPVRQVEAASVTSNLLWMFLPKKLCTRVLLKMQLS